MFAMSTKITGLCSGVSKSLRVLNSAEQKRLEIRETGLCVLHRKANESMNTSAPVRYPYFKPLLSGGQP